MGILGAYVRKLQTGAGARVEANLFSAGIDLQCEALTMYFAAPNRHELSRRDRHVGSWYHDAPYGLYELADCRIVLSMNDPAKLAEALDSDTLRELAGHRPLCRTRPLCAGCGRGAARRDSFADVSRSLRRAWHLVRARAGLRRSACRSAGRPQQRLPRSGCARKNGDSDQSSFALRRRSARLSTASRSSRARTASRSWPSSATTSRRVVDWSKMASSARHHKGTGYRDAALCHKPAATAERLEQTACSTSR